MPNYQKHIVYLSDAQRQELFTNGTITANGQTVVYDDNDMYVTPQADPVIDVQLAGASVVNDGVATVPVASASTYGAVRFSTDYGLQNIAVSGNQRLGILAASTAEEKTGTNNFKPVVPSHQHEAAFYGLAKAAGADEKDSSLSVGQYTDNAKAAIRSMLGAASAADIPSVPVQDVQVNGTSVLSNGIANVPVAGNGINGVVQVSGNQGLCISQTTPGLLVIGAASSAVIKTSQHAYAPIVPSHQHEATFYGLAKAAGDVTQSASSNAVGTYTESAKASIRNMLGAASTNIVAVQDEQPTDTDTKVWLPETQAAGVEVPTYAEFTAGLATKVGFTDYATSSTAGVMKVNDKGVKIENGELAIRGAGSSAMKAGTNDASVITPWGQHQAAFYGLAKAAGADLASAENITVGTYPTTASAAIRSMLGAVGDVQVNGTSVVSNGTATIPIAHYHDGANDDYGLVKINGSNGITLAGDGCLSVNRAPEYSYKSGNDNYKMVTPYGQHRAVFYGLAKAAGADEKNSTLAFGQYTDTAKSAIQSMLGIDLQSIASEVEIPLVETVSGTTPTISGQPNTRYVCGEVSTLSITPPSAGSIDVIFDSGSTPAVITVPNTVRWPAWFDATALEADTTYEILITDGVYGSVMTWAN